MRKIVLSILVLMLFAAVIVITTSISVQMQDENKQNHSPQPGGSATDEHAPGTFFSDLPIVLIESNDADIEKTEKIWTNITVIDHPDGKNYIDDTPTFSSLVTIKHRGNSSYETFDKLSYRVEFFYNQTNKKNYAFLGMNAHSDWVLNGPFLDRTLIRNRFAFTLAQDMNFPWSPDTRYFELFVDGTYKGVYLAIEPITVGENRIDLYRFGMISGATPYIIRRERVGTQDSVIHTYGYYHGKTSYDLNVDYPSVANITDTELEWIAKDVSQFEEVLYSDQFAHPEYGYAKYIDVDSFVDYMLLNELVMIHDASFLSSFTYKNLQGKLTMVGWDFNNGFDNYAWKEHGPEEGFFLKNGNWFNRLLQDRAFVDKVVKRYQQLRGSAWSTDKLTGLIDQNVAFLGDAIDRNFSVWGYTFEERLLSSVDDVSRDPNNYDEAISMLKGTLLRRLAWLDKNMNSLYDSCVN